MFADGSDARGQSQTTADHARQLGVQRAIRRVEYPGPQQDEFLPRRRNGHPQRPRHPAANSKSGKQQEYQERAQVRNSLDEDGSLAVGLWSLDLGRRELRRSGVSVDAVPDHATVTERRHPLRYNQGLSSSHEARSG